MIFIFICLQRILIYVLLLLRKSRYRGYIIQLLMANVQ